MIEAYKYVNQTIDLTDVTLCIVIQNHYGNDMKKNNSSLYAGISGQPRILGINNNVLQFVKKCVLKGKGWDEQTQTGVVALLENRRRKLIGEECFIFGSIS